MPENLSYPRSLGPYAASGIFSIVRHEDAHMMNDDLTPVAHYSSLSLSEALLNASWSRNTVKKYAIRRSIPAAFRVRLRAS